MKILILCGSLEPGANGVGDYSRCLADAIRGEHQVQLVSICDKETARESSTDIEVRRFKGALIDTQVAGEVMKEVHNFDPDVVSLQFVPFAFDRKGLIKKLIPFVTEVIRSIPLHIMFHELWLGEKPSHPLKHKILGVWQKRLMLRALQSWKPKLVHTSNPHYRDVLGRNHTEAKILPLFGNIPISDLEAEGLQTHLTWYPPKPNERVILFPFSQSHSWRSQQIMEILLEASQEAGVSLRLVQVGKNPSGEIHWPRIRAFAGKHDWSCDILGPQDEVVLSQLMLAADVGVSSAHVQLAGKSGAVVGMLEHGLPVLCTSWEVESRHAVPESPELAGLKTIEEPVSVISELLRNPPKTKPQSRLQKTADQWVHDLEVLI